MPVNVTTRPRYDFAMIYGEEASYQENRTFEDSMFWVSGLSAVKGLQILKAMGVNITELTPPMTYSNPNLPSVVVTDINNALHMGWKVIVPEETGGLPAIPYIKYDEKTGSAGYMIATMAGGFNFDISPIDHEEDLTWIKDFYLSNGIKFLYKVLDPVSPYLVAMGDAFLLTLETTAEAADGSRVVKKNPIFMDTNQAHYAQGKWPLYSIASGQYKYKYDGKDLFALNVWGSTINSDASGKYIGISTENMTERIDVPLTIRFSVKGYPGLNISSVEMKIYSGYGTLSPPIRTISGLSAGENQTTSWDGKDYNGQIVSPGIYAITIEEVGNGKAVESLVHFIVAFRATVLSADVTQDQIQIKLEPAGVSGTLRLELTGINTYPIRNEARAGNSGELNETFDITRLILTAGDYAKVKATWSMENIVASGSKDYPIQVFRGYKISQYRIVTEEACGIGADQTICIKDLQCRYAQEQLSRAFANGIWMNGTGRRRNGGNYLLYGNYCTKNGYPLPGACWGTYNDGRPADYQFEERTDNPYPHRANGSVAVNDLNPDGIRSGDRVYIYNLGVREVTDRCPDCTANGNRQLDNFLGEDGGCNRANDFAGSGAVVIKLVR